MHEKIQGLIVLAAGSVVLFVASIGSIALATGAATGAPYPYYIAGYGLLMTAIGWVGFKELRPGFQAIPWAMGLLALSTAALIVYSRFQAQ